MSNILTHDHNGTRWLFVEVPNDYFNLKVEKLDDCDPDDYLYLNDDFNWWKLPNGIWQIHSVTNTMTEEQAMGIVYVDSVPYGELTNYIFVNYFDEDHELGSALESLGSLITSLGGSPDKNYVVLKNKER